MIKHLQVWKAELEEAIAWDQEEWFLANFPQPRR